MSPTHLIHKVMNEIHPDKDTLAELAYLRKIDVNLLVSFDALAREQSVTKAAQRMGVTQSAMSHTLRRLRALFHDPILVRGKGGMLLTPRAQSLVIPLRSGLVTLGRALCMPQDFDLASSRRGFRIASPDIFDALALPALLETVQNTAPGIDLAFVPPSSPTLFEQLEAGELDLAVVVLQDKGVSTWSEETSPGLVRKAIYRDKFACLLRADHPALARTTDTCANTLSLETFVALSHILVSPAGKGPGIVDHYLAKHGLARRIALRLPIFHSALAILTRSDLLLTAPASLAQLHSVQETLAVLPPPLPLPGHTVYLLWHQRFSDDPGHRWLRAQITEIARNFSPAVESVAKP